MKIELTTKEKEEIRILHSKCKERRHADKLKSIMMLNRGLSCEEIGIHLMLDDDTIRGYGKQYLEQGAASLLSDGNQGTHCLLSKEQLDELEAHISENTYQDSKGIIAWIKANFEVSYTVSGINALLKRMNFVYKKPVKTPCKADVAKQEEFVNAYQKVKASLKEEDQIYFMDGVHPQHNSMAGYGWIKKGTTKFLKTNNGRKRININGSINLQTKQLQFTEDEKINAQSMIKLLKKMLQNQPIGLIYIILDNARYYHAKIVKDFLEEHPRIKLMFLPPYSPNLNIIERLWKILKQKVVYNKFYLKFEEFRKKVIEFLESQPWNKKEFEKILTDKFQIIKPNFSGFYL